MGPPAATACAAAPIPSRYPARLLATACWRRPQTAISVTATPMTSSSTVVSMSSRRKMANRSYGRVRKKSNQTAADRAATNPASRYPFAATATTSRISTSAASVFGKLARQGTRIAARASGARTAASMAARSRPGLCHLRIPP